MEALKMIADINLGNVLNENLGQSQTQTGRDLLEGYYSKTMSSHINCSLVNQFLQEAKQHMYDSGVQKAVSQVMQVLNENNYSWALATVVESISGNQSKYNYLNRNAATHVERLLENRSEDEVVNYIKAGALKNVMFCEGFRNVVKSIFKDKPVVVESAQFRKTNPISLAEERDGQVYFMVENKIYSFDKEMKISEHQSRNSVSLDFLQINGMLNEMEYRNGSYEYTLSGRVNDITYIVSEAGNIMKRTGEEETTMTVSECREQNKLFLTTVNPQHRARTASILENICKVAENFENIVLVEEVSIIETRNDKLYVVEGSDKTTVSLLNSRTSMPYTRTYTSIVEALNDIKKNSKVDLTNLYEASIEKEMETKQINEGIEKEMQIQESANDERRKRIELLTEKYKHDPATLAVLASVASELNDMN